MIQAAGGVMVDTPLAHVVRLSIKWANTTACLSIVADHVRPFMTSEHPSAEDVSSRTMHHVTKFKWLQNVVLNIISSLYANGLHMVITCQNQEIYIIDVLIHNLWALSLWIRAVLKAKKGSNQILARYNKKVWVSYIQYAAQSTIQPLKKLHNLIKTAIRLHPPKKKWTFKLLLRRDFIAEPKNSLVSSVL